MTHATVERHPSTAASPDRRAAAQAWVLIFAVAASGALLAAPFLYPSLFPLAWVALVPLLWAVQRAGGARRAFLLAWIAGALAHVLGFYWVDHTVRVFGGIPHGVSQIALLLYSFGFSVHVAVFGLLVHVCGLGPLALFPPILWVAVEFFAPQLFPWHLANSQSAFLTLLQSADVAGPYGASFLVAWFNAVVYAAVFSRELTKSKLTMSAAALAIALFGALSYGHLRLKNVDAEMRAAPKLDIAAVQGSIDIGYKWNVAFLAANLKTYLDLTQKTPGARLYLWPENTIESWVPDDMERLPPEMVPAMPAGSSLIFGTISFTGRPNTPEMKAFNSVFLIDAQGRARGRYHKQALLAFGEYIPFAPLLSHVPGMPPIGEGFTRGEGPATLELPDGVKVAPLICYEDIMPELARRFVREKGANLLVNLTNDAWFGNTAAPWEHARLAQLRSIETRRNLVRVTNTGLTTIINPKGEMLQTLPLFSPGVLTAKVEIMGGETIYVKYGDWFAWMVAGVSVLILLRRWRKGGQ